MDINQIMKLLQDPNVQKLIQSFMGQFMGGQGGGQQANLQGLLDQLSKAGLGDQVQSWTGTGENQPLTPQQLQDALGTSGIDQAAAAAGMGPEDAAKDLANVLPSLVNEATPQGQVPQGGVQLQDLLNQILGGATAGAPTPPPHQQ